MNKKEEALKVPQPRCDRLTDPSEISALSKYMKKRVDALQDSIELNGEPSKTATSELKNDLKGLGGSVERLNVRQIRGLEREAVQRIIGKPGDVSSLGNQRVEAEGLQDIIENKLSGNLEKLGSSIEPNLDGKNKREQLKGEKIRDPELGNEAERIKGEKEVKKLQGKTEKLRVDTDTELGNMIEMLAGEEKKVGLYDTALPREGEGKKIELSGTTENLEVENKTPKLKGNSERVIGEVKDPELRKKGEKVIHKMWGVEIVDSTVEELGNKREQLKGEKIRDPELGNEAERIKGEKEGIEELTPNLETLGVEGKGFYELPETEAERIEEGDGDKEIRKLSPTVQKRGGERKEIELTSDLERTAEGSRKIEKLNPILEDVQGKREDNPELEKTGEKLVGKITEINLSSQREDLGETPTLDSLGEGVEKVKDVKNLLHLNPVQEKIPGEPEEIRELKGKAITIDTKPLEDLHSADALDILGTNPHIEELRGKSERVEGEGEKDIRIEGLKERVIGEKKETPNLESTATPIPDLNEKNPALEQEPEKVIGEEGGIEHLPKNSAPMPGTPTTIEGLPHTAERVEEGDLKNNFIELPTTSPEKVDNVGDGIQNLEGEAERVKEEGHIEIPDLPGDREGVIGGEKEIALGTERELVPDAKNGVEELGTEVESITNVPDDPSLSGHREDLTNIPEDPELGDYRESLEDNREVELRDQREKIINTLEDPSLLEHVETLTDDREVELGTEVESITNVPDNPELSEYREDLSDNRDVQLGDYRENLTDDRETELSGHREDLTDNRDVELGDYRENITDDREVELGNYTENLTDDRDIQLEDYVEELTDNREIELGDYRENITDDREVELEDYREDLKDEGVDSLSDFLDTITAEDVPKLSDHREDLKDNRDVSLSDAREDLKNTDLVDSLSDFLDEITDDRDVSLSDIVEKTNKADKINVGENSIEDSPAGDGSEHKGWVTGTLDERVLEGEDKNENSFNPDEDKLYEGTLGLEEHDKTNTDGEVLKGWDENLEDEVIERGVDQNGDSLDSDDFINDLIEILKSRENLNLYYTNILKFAENKNLGSSWGSKVASLMSAYLSAESPSEERLKEFEKQLFKSVFVEYQKTPKKEGEAQEVEKLGTDVRKLDQAGKKETSEVAKGSVEGPGQEGKKDVVLKNESQYVTKYKLNWAWQECLDMSQYLRWVAEKATFGSHGSLRAMLLDTTLMTLVATRNVAERLSGANRDRLPGGSNVLGSIVGMTQGNLVENAKAAARKVAKAGIKALVPDLNNMVDKSQPLNRPDDKWYETRDFQSGNNRKPNVDPSEANGGGGILKSIGKALLGEVKGLVGLGGPDRDYNFAQHYTSSNAISTTLCDLCGVASTVGTVEELRMAIETSPIMTSASKVTTTNFNNKTGKVTTLDDNSNWEIMLFPFLDSVMNGGCSYLPSIREINSINSKQFGLTTAYNLWIPITSFELSKAKMVSKTLQLYNGEISYPVGMEYTNELRLTIADDQYKSWRRYFEMCANCAIYNSTLHRKGYYKELTSFGSAKLNEANSNYKGGEIETKIDKTFICPAPYKNITFRCAIYCMTPQKETIDKYDLLVVMKDFSEERTGDIEAGGSDLTVSFSIVGEHPGISAVDLSTLEDFKNNRTKRRAMNAREKAADKAALVTSIAQAGVAGAVGGALDMI